MTDIRENAENALSRIAITGFMNTGEPYYYRSKMLDMFVAGAAWAKANQEVAPSEFEAYAFKNVMAMLEQINKTTVELHSKPVASFDFNQDAVMRMLGSIENRMIEGQERTNKDLYHVTHRQESIDIELRRMIVDVGQKVEAVLTQAVSNGELIEAVHGLVAEPPIENVCVQEDERDNLDRVNDECRAEANADAINEAMINALLYGTGAVKITVTPPDDIYGRGYVEEEFHSEGSQASKRNPVNPLASYATVKDRIFGVDLAKPGSDKTSIGIATREGSKYIVPPYDAGDFVDMINFNGIMIVAYQKGVFRVAGDSLIPLRFVAS